MRVTCAAGLAGLVVAAGSCYSRSQAGLGGVSRVVPARGRLRCPRVPLVSYRGAVLRYQRPLKIHPSFRPALVRFERLVHDAAVQVYGRPPRRITHMGTYNCRRIRGYPYLLSEHALGNAIDVSGFRFAAARGGSAPPGLRSAFSVRIAAHWSGRGRGAVHRRFLRLLMQRVDRAGLFQVALRPGNAGHHDHLHLDCSPGRLRKALHGLLGLRHIIRSR